MTTSIDGVNGPWAKPVVVSVRGSNEQSSPSKPDEVKAEAPADAQRVSDATRKVEELFQSVRRNLEFREDPSSGRLVVSVIDSESGEIIRQIPPEQMIRMAEHLEQMNGLLLGERA
jgi:flagellar protein FlaG